MFSIDAHRHKKGRYILEVKLNEELIAHIISISLEYDGESISYMDAKSLSSKTKVEATFYCLENKELRLERDLYKANITLQELEAYSNVGINIE